MASASDKTCFVELNDHSLIAARTSSTGSPVTVEHLEEVRTDNKAALAEAVGTIFPETKSGTVRVICAVRPAQRFFHLATPDEAKKHASAAALKSFITQPPFAEYGASDVAAVLADGGGLLDGKGSRWLLAGAPQDSVGTALAALRELKLDPIRVESATVSLLGACQAAVALAKDTGPVLVWEVGEKVSDLFMVGAEGIQAARRLGFGFDAIVDAIATEINLKFKASAAKLFFNDLYDFSETGPKIGSRMGSQLQAEVSALALQSGRQPVQFLCTGFPGKQQWFSESVAKGLNLAPWRPDVAAWCGKAGVKFASGSAPEGFSPAWYGVLGAAAAFRADRPEHDAVWHPVLHRFGPAPAEEKPAPAPAAAAPVAKAAAPAPAPAAKPAPAPAPAPVKAAAPAPAAKPTPTPAPVAAKAAPASTPAKKDEKAAPAPAPAKKDEKAAPAPAKKDEKAAPAPVAAKKDEKPAPASGAAPKKSFFASPVGIAAVIGLLVVLGGGYFMFSSMQESNRKAEAERVAAQQAAAAAEARAKADAEALRVAQEKAQAEAEARRQAEAEAIRREEENAQRSEAERQRLLTARGSLRVVTTPAGATVSVDNMTPRETPATFTDLRLGKYTAEISMAGYEPTTIEVEVKEDQTSDPGVVRLVRHLGSLDLATDPAGVTYEVRPGAERFGSNVKQGATPATLEGLPTGEYLVTLAREGWPPHSETVLVERNRVTKVTRNFSGGAINVTSLPQGATVIMDGKQVGTTPVTITDVPLGNVSLQVQLATYQPRTISGTVEASKPLDLNAILEPIDPIAKTSELDERPLPVKTVQPIADPGRFRDKFAMVSVVVDREGMPTDVKVEKSNDEEFAVLCLEAVRQWRFTPGRIRGQPVKARVTVPFSIR